MPNNELLSTLPIEAPLPVNEKKATAPAPLQNQSTVQSGNPTSPPPQDMTLNEPTGSSEQMTYPNGDPAFVVTDSQGNVITDANGNPIYVNSSGQVVDENGNPMWYDKETGQYVYFGYDKPSWSDQYEYRYWNESNGSASYWGDNYDPVMIDGTITPVYEDPENPPTLQQETYPNGDPMYVDENGKYVNSSGYLVDENGDVIPGSTRNEPILGTGDPQPVMVPIMEPGDENAPLLDSSVPDAWVDPLALESDILTKSDEWLVLLTEQPRNSNNAIGFLLYTSNLADEGYFGDENGNAFSEGLLSITNSDGKTLVAECVDITMEQMVLNGYTPEQAHDEIYELFPGDDPVSVAARNEADAELKVMQTPGYENPDQMGIHDEWEDFITDPETESNIDEAHAELRGAMLEGCSENLYLAIIEMLRLLEAEGILKMDVAGVLSTEIADASDDLNEIITEWEDGTAYDSPADAEAWMQEIQDLQEEMNDLPFDDATMTSINANFDKIYDSQAMGYQQETYPNGDPVYVDDNGDYVNASGQRVDDQGNAMYSWTGDGGQGQYVYKENGYTYLEVENPDGTYSPLPAEEGNRTSTDGTYTPVKGEGTPEPVYEASPLYVDTTTGQTYYKQEDGTYVNANTGAVETPTGPVEELTIGDLAFGYTDSKNVKHDPNPELLQDSLEAIQPQDLNFDDPSQGGESEQYQAINDALNALVAPLSSQSSAVGTELQLTMTKVEQVDNEFSSVIEQEESTLDAVGDGIRQVAQS